MTARATRHGEVSAALGSMSDERLGALLAAAPVLSSGIGGTAVALEIGGFPVFAKQVPLTALEARPEHFRSTANLFGLPPHYQYGIGSKGAGVWRELAVHLATTGWALDGRCENFPLLHHWRVLPGAPDGGAHDDEIDAMVEYWDGSPAVRARLTALAAATSKVVLCCERLPCTLADRLASEPDPAWVERDLLAVTKFLSAHGIVHFDAHFDNVLTDGERLYVSDFGLATSLAFELSPEEKAFAECHRHHDVCYALAHLVSRLVIAATGATDRHARTALIRRWASGEHPAEVPAAAETLIRRYAPVAVVVNEFYDRLYAESRAVPYPAAELDRVCREIGLALPGPRW